MNSTEGLKRLLYNRFLHFSELFEQSVEVELTEFATQARALGLDTFPNNMTSIHVIDCIGSYEPINNTSIADKMNLSKASITKFSNKLLEEGYIKRSQLNDNKKEVYFSLSSKGKHVFKVHQTVHEMIERRFISTLSSFSELELQTTLKFIQIMIDQLNAYTPSETNPEMR
ncbi:putative HTH-type transcriptional regulator YvmB [Pullulanibacillus camelliae]|uniref:Putative HTH-type transcriptional regulator YvmB n=1 Tax=Pullulanibacillus camelliae TaxID=1707096 RepID=A0A8J2VNK7_9BACL|nr:MarR family transcriptional regulator [Pullulanibacillus camelliae]GGE35767.1 putative HTH-type transcriptional regulator YvmB [Pullulanibacillus camelliae]